MQADGRVATGRTTAGEQDLQQDAVTEAPYAALVNLGGDGAQPASYNAEVEAIARRQRARSTLPGPEEKDAAERQLKTVKCTSSPTAGATRCTLADANAACLRDQPTTCARSSCTRG